MQAPSTETQIEPILFFDGDYAWLSNFWWARVQFEGKWYPTVEHAFQAAKTFDPYEQMLIRKAASPADAKYLGRQCKLRRDWNEVRFDIMLDLVRQKFSIPKFRELLLATGDAYIEEGNYWNDRIWGVYNGKGLNWLGKIIMQVRDEIRRS